MSETQIRNLYDRIYNPLLNVLAVVLAICALIGEYGFRTPPVSPIVLHIGQITAATLLWWNKIYKWGFQRRSDFSLRKLIPDAIFIVLFVTGLWIAPKVLPLDMTAAEIRWAVFHIYLLLLTVVRITRWTLAVAAVGRAPTQILLVSFAGIIIIGALLLMLPSAHIEGQLSFTDALFTATSATCVTGLIVRDTGGDFTMMGQLVILSLIQIGGLGIMIFGALFAMLLGSQLTVRESVAMRDIMNEQTPGQIGKVVVFVCISTLLLELIGAVCLLGTWHEGDQVFFSIFHSISAFCNAGFSLNTDSLMSYRSSWQSYLVICPLIIVGGLGFPVLINLWSMLKYQIKKRREIGDHLSRSTPVRMSLQSKIVLTTTGFLLVFGFVLFVILDLTRPNQAAAEHSYLLVFDSFFNSVTARTAGFNTIDIGQQSAASKLVFILLMTIGGSPTSTAGGIKTVTFAVMVLSVYTTMRRRSEIHVFHRSIPIMIVRRASTLLMLYVTLTWMLTLLLTITEHSRGTDMLDLLFEVVSALGTVGLSTGVTEHLTVAGKWVIIFAMFAGRLGPLSLLTALTLNAKPIHYDYPREPLVVG